MAIRSSDVDFSAYELLDIGGDVNSLEWMKEYLGVDKRIGLNIENSRLENMASRGFDCVNMNCFEIPSSVSVPFVCMSHFLEHLINRDQVFQMIDKSIEISEKGVYISGPCFESDAKLREFGFKFVWGDWTGHSSRFSVELFLRNLLLRRDINCTISLGFNVDNSNEDNIVHLLEAPNINSYAKDAQIVKDKVEFPISFPQEFVIFVDLQGNVASKALAQTVHAKRHGVPGVPIRDYRDAAPVFAISPSL